MTFEVAYRAGQAPTLSVGPLLVLEAPDTESAKDLYIQQCWPLVWSRHWELYEKGSFDDPDYEMLWEVIQARDVSAELEAMRLRKGFRLVKGNATAEAEGA